MFGFEIRTAFLVLLLAAHIFGDSSPHLSHNITTVKYNSADTVKASSSLDDSGTKHIQSVPSIDVNHSHPTRSTAAGHNSDNFTDLVRLEDVLTVFDLNELAAKWSTIQHDFQPKCRQDMTEYFRGLQMHNIWATKSKFIWY